MSYAPLRGFMSSVFGEETPKEKCEILESDATFNAPFGYNEIEVTKEDIEALLAGKVLLSNASEYRVTISLAKA